MLQGGQGKEYFSIWAFFKLLFVTDVIMLYTSIILPTFGIGPPVTVDC